MAHYHHGNLRESLIQAGDDELRTKSPQDLSLRALSRKLQVSHNAPYRHFADKSALLNEILLRTLRDLSERLTEAELIYPYSPVHQVQYFGRAWALLSLQHPRKVELLFGSLRLALENQPIKAQFDLIVESIAGLIRTFGEDGARLKSQALVSAFLGCALSVASGCYGYDNDHEIFALFDEIAENLLNPTPV